MDWNALNPKHAEASEVTPLNLLGARIIDEEAAAPANGGGSDLLIRGLVERLPAIDEVWPFAERVKWLRTAATIFALVYRPGDGEEGEIGVALTGAAAKPETLLAKPKDAEPAETADCGSAKKEEPAPEKASADFSVLRHLST
ncbi:MAG: hypothetical protein AB7V40_06935 [Methyloceanibacter sp.]